MHKLSRFTRIGRSIQIGEVLCRPRGISEARRKMAQTAAASIPVGRVALGALFVGFLKVSLLGIGGGPVWARRIAVDQKCWVTDREFADCFAVSQVVPGPNIILMMGLVGLKVGGIPGAVAAALATFGPPCLMYYTAYRLWDRFRDAPWQRVVRLGRAH